MENENPIVHVGNLNGYDVETEAISKRFFVKTTKVINGEEKTKSVPVRISRKNVHVSKFGQRVTLSAYRHGGIIRYADSRVKQSRATPKDAVSELCRMLLIQKHEAHKLLELE